MLVAPVERDLLLASAEQRGGTVGLGQPSLTSPIDCAAALVPLSDDVNITSSVVAPTSTSSYVDASLLFSAPRFSTVATADSGALDLSGRAAIDVAAAKEGSAEDSGTGTDRSSMAAPSSSKDDGSSSGGADAIVVAVDRVVVVSESAEVIDSISDDGAVAVDLALSEPESSADGSSSADDSRSDDSSSSDEDFLAIDLALAEAEQ